MPPVQSPGYYDIPGKPYGTHLCVPYKPAENGRFTVTAKSPGGVGSPRPTSHCIKTCPRGGHTFFVIYYFLFIISPPPLCKATAPLPQKQSPPPAENRQTGANQTYFTSSFGSKMFSKIATIAAGTMPEPPNTSRTASGVCARIPVLAPIP